MEQDLRAKINSLAQKQADMQKALRLLSEEGKTIDAELRELIQRAGKKENADSPHHEKLTDAIEQQRKKIETASPPPIPKKFAQSVLAKATPTERKKENTTKASPSRNEPQPTAKHKDKPSFNPGEWEINFGKVWLVRIGILLLLTGLIFLSTYAYKNWLFNAGAGAKVAFFMTISFTLTGVGMWLEKRRKRFQQYGRVLASGGLAAGYYTVYASHFAPSLKLIDSPILAGLLLTLWAGVMLAYAVWKKSRVVAVMAIGLAFYGTVVNPAGWLSLFSALLLSSAGIWLMVRFKWMGIGLGTMLAAYISHAFWMGGVYSQDIIEFVRFTYLGCYWLLFTAALAMPQAREIPIKIQRIFCAINNIAVWQLTVFLIPDFIPHAQTGWISIGIGLLWLGLAAVAHAGKFWHRSLAPIFAYQGILVASFGILLEATGYTRFLLLAVEACLLMARAQGSTSKLLRWVSAGIFICALATALPQFTGSEAAAWQSYAALALVCVVYTALLHFDVKRAVLVWGAHDELSRLVPVLSALVTWLVLGYGVFSQWPALLGMNGLWMSATVVVLVYFLTKKAQWIEEVALTSSITAMAATVWFIAEQGAIHAGASIIPLLGTLTFWLMSPRLSTAWDNNLTEHKQTAVKKPKVLEWFFSLAFWTMLTITLHHEIASPKAWMVIGGLLALIGHAAGEYTRRRSIAVPALLFHFSSLATLALYGTQEPLLGWMPAVLLLLHLIFVDTLWEQLERKTMRLILALLFTLTTGLHSFQIFARPDLALTVLGLGMMAWAYRRKDQQFAIAAAVLPLITACLGSTLMHDEQDWPRYLPIIATLVLHAILWCKTKEDGKWTAVRVFLISAGVTCLVLSTSVHVLRSFHGSGLAICWALLASFIFAMGLRLRCRPYRLIGLFWLAAAVLHVVFIDVMRLETLGRILSFITLGVVLLGLGFLYNRYQETIRKFL